MSWKSLTMTKRLPKASIFKEHITMKKITENTKVTLTLKQLKRLVKESIEEDGIYYGEPPRSRQPRKPERSKRGVRFASADDIRDWMLQNEKQVVKMLAGDELGATTWAEFVNAMYEGQRPGRGKLSYERFVNAFCKDGTAWEEFEGASLRDLADMLNGFVEEWI